MPIEPDPRDLPPGLAPAWASSAPKQPRRGPKPAHTVEEIVTAAVEVADAEGLAGASLPNIAASLGLTTNALYRYVGSKEELLVLLADAGFGPPPLLAAGAWRDEVRAWTEAALLRYEARPWLLDIPFHGDALTPHRLRWTELLLRTFTTAGLPDSDALGCAQLITDLTRTTAARRRAASDPDAATAPGRAEAVRSFLAPVLGEDGYSSLAALTSAGRYPAEPAEGFALERVLEGIGGLVVRESTS
ncbi:helix-turn-helix domain-containing protein [Amycolatopsis rhabdoformis]|uniref:Helix-turn-helix domain-containing protein n=1 Tax=Amycolatopsis rhabdoformis TaxID=1448059 RepID=A0ABZ1HW06_9PSEU|nr:helix-turn-helix domain-containing protein [Amycolatopsis rhabdoformis]WSE26415.1 helix-turn-helix domain-containing protein [Amycolatopsis rhabdoformis]